MDYVTTLPTIQNIQSTRACAKRAILFHDDFLCACSPTHPTYRRRKEVQERVINRAERNAAEAYDVGVDRFGKEKIDRLLKMRPQIRFLMSLYQIFDGAEKLRPKAQAILDQYYEGE